MTCAHSVLHFRLVDVVWKSIKETALNAEKTTTSEAVRLAFDIVIICA